MVLLLPEDVPGAVLDLDKLLEDHSVLELQRWLECRGLKKTGIKSELISRINHCIAAGNDAKIFIGIDGGRWYDAKRNIDNIASTSRGNTTVPDHLVWKKFPSTSIPKYFNKGHIYSYIIGENVDNEDPEIIEIGEDNMTVTTVKPFRRAHQFVDSDHISDIHDCEENNVYHVKCKCFSSFQKTVQYNVNVILNKTSGAISGGLCECKQSSLGKCSHITALLIFLWKHVEQYGDIISCTSQPRQWDLGAKKRNPSAVTTKPYPIKRFKPTRRPVFDPRPDDYVRDVKINNFVANLQKTGENSMFQSILEIKYEDFLITGEELNIIRGLVQQFLENMEAFMNKEDTTLVDIEDTIQSSENWLRWRSYFITSTNAKIVATQLQSDNAKKNFLLKNLWRATKPIETVAMKYGKYNENNARQEYATLFLQKNQRLIVAGLVVNKNYPHLASSVDGIVMETDDELESDDEIHHLIEIKCPKVLEHCQNIINFDIFLTRQQLNNFFLEKKNNKITVKKNHPYLYQVLMSLIIFETELCDLIIWNKQSMLIIPGYKKDNLDIIEKIQTNIISFYKNIYVPEMFIMRAVRNLPPIDLRNF